ncbi:hypothetical protein [Paracoccus xiamenensis]|uniref:hypothetical protein n=1 Tax=Paracoccus xiamenensis TaxID=2714901 RepID=UPI00140A41A0|nr:hypothetical protein [Paracoccus xiamenensis]NHF71577.1 hypothetical protein [Paracoccus xiamenensis]
MRALAVASVLVFSAAAAQDVLQRLDVKGFPHLAATPDSLARCAGLHRFMAENRVEIGPNEPRLLFDAAAPNLPSVARSLNVISESRSFADMVSQSESKWATPWSASEGDSEGRVALQWLMIEQYYGCLGMIDDLIGAGRLEVP